MIVKFRALTLTGLLTAAALFGQDAAVSGLPSIGKWLIDKTGTAAHWLGEKHDGKTLREPINVIIVDRFATTTKEAVNKLVHEAARCGYDQDIGHSGGYRAIINGTGYGQVPARWGAAFASAEFFMPNNHGRIMGPCLYNGKLIFVGAFSREEVGLKPNLHHSFVSFTVARNDFCQKINAKGTYRITGKYFMGNVQDDVDSTTADHDGLAIVLEAVK